MKVILKSDRKTIEFVDGITKVNANDVNWQLFEIELESPLALRESLWITYQNEADEMEHTHPFLVSVTQTGVYYAKIPAEIIIRAGVWNFQLFIRQYATTGNGKYVQYPSNVYSFTVENGLPVDGEGMPVSSETIAAMYNTARDIIRRFYSAEKAITIHCELQSSEVVKAKSLTGCTLIDWGDGTMEDGSAKTATEYTHTYDKAGKYIVKFFGVTNIGANAFANFNGIYDLELHSSLLSIGEFAFAGSAINKLTIPASVEYISNCFLTTDKIKVVEVEQSDPVQFNKNAFKHFLANLPMECTVIVPYLSLEAYKQTYISTPSEQTFAASATATEGLSYMAQPATEAYVNDIGTGMLPSLSAPSISISSEGKVTFTRANAIGFRYIINDGQEREVEKSGYTLYLEKGDYIQAMAIGNGTTYQDSDYSAIKTYTPNSANYTSLDYELLDDDTYEIVGSSDYTGIALILPTTYRNKPVSSIKSYAFESHETLRAVTVGEHITNIGNHAFYNCLKLQQAKVSAMGDYMFVDCTNLVNLTITNNISRIPKFAFAGCTRLTEITLPSTLTRIGDNAFVECQITELIVPNSVTIIGSSAFSNCQKLAQVTLSSSLETIGRWAFEGTALAYVKIPASVRDVNEYAFNCDSLTVLEIESDTADFNLFPIADVVGKNLEKIIVPAGCGTLYKTKWEDYADIIIEEEVNLDFTLSDDKTYYIVTGLGEITGAAIVIPSKYSDLPVKEIGESAFAGNTEITSLHIPSSVEKVGDNAFNECSALASVTFTEGLKEIGKKAFNGVHITTLNLPTSLEKIGDWAFWGAHILSLVIPGNVTYIGASAFASCVGLRTVDVKAVTPPEIGKYVFLNTALHSITVPTDSISAYRTAWSDYADYLPESENEGETPEEPDGPNNPDSPDSPDIPVIPLEKLEVPYVEISDYGVAHFISANAVAYAFKIDGGAEVRTTATFVQLLDGQTFKVKAIGDNVYYKDSDYSQSYTYIEDLIASPDIPYLPELEDVEITINPFDCYALYKEVDSRLADLEDNEDTYFNDINDLYSTKQDKTDSTLETESKKIVGAINEHNKQIKSHANNLQRLNTSTNTLNSQASELFAKDTILQDEISSVRNTSASEILKLATQAAETAKKLEEVELIAKNAEIPLDFDNYQQMIDAFNNATATTYFKGIDVHIVTQNVPDLWISKVVSNYIAYVYVSDSEFEKKLTENERVQVGYYLLSATEGGKIFMEDYTKKEEHYEDIKALLSLFPIVQR